MLRRRRHKTEKEAIAEADCKHVDGYFRRKEALVDCTVRPRNFILNYRLQEEAAVENTICVIALTDGVPAKHIPEQKCEICISHVGFSCR